MAADYRVAGSNEVDIHSDTDGQTDIQTDRQTDRRADRQTISVFCCS